MPVPSVSLALPHWLESHSQWMWIPRHPPDTWLQLWTPSPHHCSTPHRYQHHQCCANCDKSHLQESSAYQPTKSSSLEYFSVYVVNYVLARAHDPHKVGPMHFRFKTINHTVLVSTICGSCTLLHSLLLRPQGGVKVLSLKRGLAPRPLERGLATRPLERGLATRLGPRDM